MIITSNGLEYRPKTSREKLLDLITYIAYAVEDATGINYITEEDFNELKDDWSTTACYRAYTQIKDMNTLKYCKTIH